MKLRVILMVLALQAFLSAAIGGYLYFSALEKAAVAEAEHQMVSQVAMINRNLTALLSENIKPASTLAGMRAMRAALVWPNAETLALANAVLDHFKQTLSVDVCYLMDRNGFTVASSNRRDPDSFVGHNFNFRPYFKKALQGLPHAYLAIGTSSGKRGAYYSAPVYADPNEDPLGIVVIKVSIETIENELGLDPDEVVLVVDPHGIVFISNRDTLLLKSLNPLSAEENRMLKNSRQFGPGPWPAGGIRFENETQAVDAAGTEYLVHRASVALFPDWHLIHLRSMHLVTQNIYRPLIRVTGPIIFILCLLFGGSVFFFYRKASSEIRQRQQAERALKRSEERYRTLYHHTPAMLHSIDEEGRIVSVSDHWAEVLGYGPDEVVGKRVSDFFSPASRRYAEETALKAFFQTGSCKDISYQYITKAGKAVDVLLSAIADRDEQGNFARSLAVSVDVTERKKAEEALRQAKEELSRYSRELERKVIKRTREITNIFRYIPAAVYMKDKNSRYILVNHRFEELFGVENQVIQGKTDRECLSAEVARQFRRNEKIVLMEGRDCQVEEEFPIEGKPHTYLSVKFPIYDEAGSVNGVCGICTDITPLKKARDQLRRLSGSIMESQEKERGAIARELHDELGQVLTALRMDAVWLQDRLKGADGRAAERALTMCDLIDNTIEEVRGLAFRLRPGVLDDLGLVDALESLTLDFERRTQITCIFNHQEIPDVGNTVATAVYRIVQEALTNVTRHAAAGRVEVHLSVEKTGLKIEIRDDGKGFDVGGIPETGGLGLTGMRERAGLVGGQLEIRSNNNKGTRIICRIPIQTTKPLPA